VQVDNQLYTFIITIATGILLGVLFDCYRVLRGTFSTKVVMTWVTDLLYWLIATVIVFLALIVSNWGELRFYVFLGIVSGVILYYRLLSLYAIRLFSAIVRSIKGMINLIRKIIRFIIRPVALCIKIVCWPFHFISSKAKVWYHLKYPKPPIDEKKE
jgi:spore cortex biosynthesis protein YabQ